MRVSTATVEPKELALLKNPACDPRQCVAYGGIEYSRYDYFDQIAKVCKTEGLLPNLELLDLTFLTAKESLPLWLSMHHTNLRYLRLPNIMPERDINLTLPPVVDQQFYCPKLQRLELRDLRRSYTKYSASLETLNHFASSLESLTWTGLHQRLPPADKALVSRDLAPLVKLRRASLCCTKLSSLFLKAVLASSRLTILEITNCKEIPFEVLNQHGTIPTLRHFTTSGNATTEALLPFISCNAQLTKLQLQQPLPDEFLSSALLPLLVNSFQSLACLSLIWKETAIPEHGLDLLSSLRQLRRLFLSAGLPNSWRSEFLINHALMLSHLARLSKLRELEFYHDTYDNGHGWSDPSDYYQHRRMNESGNLDYAFQPAHERFEISHKRKMIVVAEDYARNMANLEWLFVGQYAFAFAFGSKGKLKQVRLPQVLHTKRIELDQDTTIAKVIRRKMESSDQTFGFREFGYDEYLQNISA